MSIDDIQEKITALANAISQERDRCLKNSIPIQYLRKANDDLFSLVENISRHITSMEKGLTVEDIDKEMK